MKILVLALSGIGDALMFTPALTLTRQAVPDAQIDAVVMFKGVQDMFLRNKKFNNVFFFDFLNRGFLPALKFLSGLRKQYDATISVYPSNRKEYNLVNFFLGAPKRAGVRYLRMDVQNFGFLNNVRTVEDDRQHNVLHNIRLCEKLLGVRFQEEPDLDFPLFDEDLQFSERWLDSMKVGATDVVVGFHPGGSTLKNHINKRWAPDKFAQLGKTLAQRHGAKVLVFGGHEEDDVKQTVASAIPSSHGIAVHTDNLAHTAAIMRRCDAFVSNDSSLLHVAAALKRKTVLIAGPINPNFSHPWNTEYRVVSLHLECSPCFVHSPRPLRCTRTDVEYKCLKELEVDLVYRAVLDLMKN
jgi:heptosyltransferase-2